MTDRKKEIKQANRKALPKFLLVLLLGCCFGGVIGFSCSYFGLERMTIWFHDLGLAFSQKAAPWLMVLCVIIDLAVGIPVYHRTRREVTAWDGEDEALADRIDHRLSIVMWLNSIIMICSLFLMTAVYAGGISAETVLGFAVTLAAFVLVLVSAIILQQKLVDLCKQLYPEKEGSIYDLKFQKKWIDSCDEAEKILIGQCAYKAYAAMGKTCLILWLVFTISALFLNTGFLPVLTVSIIWAVTQSVYCYWSLKLPSGGISAL